MAYPPKEDTVISGLKQSIAWIDRLAWIALLFMLSASIANLSGQAGVTLAGVQIPVAGPFIGMVALTLAHFFIARHIIMSCADAWNHLSIKSRNALFDDVVRTGGLLTKGANSYRDSLLETKFGLELVTSIKEPPTWLHYILVLLTFLSIVSIEWTFLALFQFCLALAIVLINWKIGESWVVCFGDLGSSTKKSRYFSDGSSRPRSISHGSGLTSISGHINFKKLSFRIFLVSVFWSIILWIFILIPFSLVYGAILLAKYMVYFNDWF